MPALTRLGITVKIVTGDNGQVAAHLCRSGRASNPASVLTGDRARRDRRRHARLELLPQTTIFARVTPEQKSRIILAQRSLGSDVGFLGDGVNDAIALHDADVGISVDSAADVAKDAADVVLLDKDLGILADGVVEGRRIFANTMKYVLMGTSSNFGNMFSAAGASLFLSFLPMLPTQILLNNLLYDVSELTIPTDNVDEELLARPSQWDIGFIRRFMTFFGPISSIYDFLTFAVMLRVFHAGASAVPVRLVRRVARRRRRSSSSSSAPAACPSSRAAPAGRCSPRPLACAAIGVAIPYSRRSPVCSASSRYRSRSSPFSL